MQTILSSVTSTISTVKMCNCSLGADHDGDNGHFCRVEDNYVMTPLLGSSVNAHNSRSFSNCSIEDFRDLIQALNDGYFWT